MDPDVGVLGVSPAKLYFSSAEGDELSSTPVMTSLHDVPIISIVDDDPSFRRATAQLIESLGYAAATFGSAEEFLGSQRLGDTACLISDVQMPGMSGIELQNRLIARGHRLPIIFVTAYSAAEIHSQALASGALGFFDKPFNEDKLISCLDQALAGRNTGS